MVKDLLGSLAERGVDLNLPCLWVIDGSKALRSAIDQLCAEAARVQCCRIHKIRNVTERLPKAKAAQTRWVMTLDAVAGIQKLKAHAKHLKAQYPDAAASLLEGLEELLTINRLGVTGELARCLATTNIIESPSSVVRRVSARVTRYRDVQMVLRWVAAGFLEAEGVSQTARPQVYPGTRAGASTCSCPNEKGRIIISTTGSNLQLRAGHRPFSLQCWLRRNDH